MSQLVVITEGSPSKPYNKFLRRGGNKIYHVDYNELDSLLEQVNNKNILVDAFIIIGKKSLDIEGVVKRIKEEPSVARKTIIVLGHVKDDLRRQYAITQVATLKGAMLVPIIEGILLAREQSDEEVGYVADEFQRVERIVRSIEFPPEYHRSGITILSYFADVLRHKNLSDDVKVSIEQSGLSVSLVIESPTGQREQVERTLEAYALVVTGKQPIETLTADPYEVAELKSQLRIASAQIESQRDLLAVKNAEAADLKNDLKVTKESVKRLEQRSDEDRARFMSFIEKLASHNADLAIGFKELAQQAAQVQNKALEGALENLYKVIERGVREEDREEVMQNLTTIQQQDPGVFRRVYEILIGGAVTGVAGNYVYAWLQFFVGTLPK